MEQSRLEQKNKKPNRLNIQVSPDMHTKLRVLAAKRWITIRELVTRAIIKYVENEEKYD